VRHPQVAAILEVLEINGRPGVLQEWLLGAPSTDLPAVAAVPGVWLRLLSQAALGLHTIHEAALIHGHLETASFILNGEGILKLCGLGEPGWLRLPPAGDRDESVQGDLADLGRIAASWAAPAARRKGTKGPLPEALQALLDRLTGTDPGQRYPSAAILLQDLEQVSAGAPRHVGAWERLLQQIRVQTAEDTSLRQSA
jgi:hypothetical protein